MVTNGVATAASTTRSSSGPQCAGNDRLVHTRGVDLEGWRVAGCGERNDFADAPNERHNRQLFSRFAFVERSLLFRSFFWSLAAVRLYPRESLMLGATQRTNDAIELGDHAAKEKLVWRQTRCPDAGRMRYRPVSDAVYGGGLRRLSGGGAEDNKRSGVQWISVSRGERLGSRGEGWQDRAVTMGVTSIKGKGYIKGCGFLVVSLFRRCRQEQRRRHNERSRTWKVGSRPGQAGRKQRKARILSI